MIIIVLAYILWFKKTKKMKNKNIADFYTIKISRKVRIIFNNYYMYNYFFKNVFACNNIYIMLLINILIDSL